MNIQKKIFGIVFHDNATIARWAYDAGYRAFLEFLLSGKNRYENSDSLLTRYKDKYVGETCVIIGNGPSLNKTDMAALKGHVTFGLNRIYLGMETFGFSPSFLVCVNKLVLEQCWEDFKAIDIPKFFSSRFGIRERECPDTVFLRPYPGNFGFAVNPIDEGVHEGATVTYVAMQLAYWMGFKKVILIGVDHNFTTSGEAHKEVVSTGDDQNHFAGNYFGKGFKWNLPDLEYSEKSYGLAKETFETDGREIVDCTVDGKCEVFRKSSLEAELG